VKPQRTSTNRRLYTDADIERLCLLRNLTRLGHRIGQIAELPTAELGELLAEDRAAVSRSRDTREVAIPAATAENHLQQCLEAINQFSDSGLRASLAEALVDLGQSSFVDQLLAPLLDRIGQLWEEGLIRVSQEHLASATVRTFIGDLSARYPAPDTAPHLLATTPAGFRHEYGALLVAATAVADGWQATYLGPDLPAEEIAGAAGRARARVAALSLIYPPDDPLLEEELRRIRRLLPSEVMLLLGGRAAPSYTSVINDIGATYLPDLQSLRELLRKLRSHRQ
jgi:methanogenic corrinoid protein MtbC1